MRQETEDRLRGITRHNVGLVDAQNRAQGAKPQKPRHDQPKGHEAYLEALRASGARVQIWLCNSGKGESLIGTLKATDKFTISLVPDCGEYVGRTMVLYKHGIECFSPVEKAA